MKLDLDQAWQSGLRFTRNNAGLLTVIAGLLFFLPAAVFGLMFVPPEVPENATWDEMVTILGAFYGETWWIMLITLVLSTLGSLAIYRLAASRDDRTGSGGLQDAVKGLLPMIGASLLVGIPVGLLFAIPLAIGGVGVFLILFVIPVAIWISMRTILSGPVLMAERTNNPVTILKRSFAITQGNSLRIFFFLLLLVIAAAIVMAIIGAVLGLVFIAVAGSETGEQLALIVSAVLESAVTVVVIACIAMIYRQLSAGPTGTTSVPPTVED